MSFNILRLNSNKTELIVLAPNAFLQKVGDRFLDFDSCSTSPSLEMHNLGVILDSTLISGIYQVPTPNLLSPTSGTSVDFGHNFSNSGADTYFLAFITSARITAIEFCLGLQAKTLTSLSMSRIQLTGFLHQHITPTLIYLRLHHTSPKKKNPSSLILVRPPPSTQIVPDSQMLRSSDPLSHQSSITPHLRTALKTPKNVPLWPPAIWYYYCLLCLVVFVYQKVLYKSRLFSLLCAATSFTKKCFKTNLHIKKKMNLTLNLCLHILYLSKTPFSTCLLSRRQ